MRLTQKNLLALAGIISTVLGLIGLVPAFLQERYGLATGSTAFVVLGLVLLAIAFGD